MPRLCILCALGLSLLALGCSPQSIIQNSLLSSLEGTQESLAQSKNPELVERALPPFIVLLDATIHKDKENPKLLMTGAKLHASFALSFVEDKDPHWAALHYESARNYASRAIAISYDIQSKDLIGQEDAKVKALLAARFQKENIDDLLWWGLSWGLWINSHRDDVQVIAEFPYVRLIMERALELDPTYENGMPHLFFGLYYSSSSKNVGGEPEKGKAHFEKLLALTHGELLSVKVIYARTYAKTVQDRKLYKNLLQEVLDAPEAKNPNYLLSNALAKKQATALLDKIDEYFVPEKETDEDEDEEKDKER